MPQRSDMDGQIQHYRRQLLEAGFREAGFYEHRYYKVCTALTAFIVNLKETEHAIEAVYGYASTAFTKMTGCENALIESGVSSEDISIREKITIRGEADENAARQIQEMYDRYLHTEKDELLKFAKEKRKSFIQQIAVKLKPLGFRKKANSWTHALEGDYYLMFNAQKSAFSDEYYFNVYISKNGTNHYGDCYDTRVFPGNMCPMDWQALSKDEFEFFLIHTVVPALEQIIHTPLWELGKLPSVWPHCTCDRKICEVCWVEKNLWEAKESLQNTEE